MIWLYCATMDRGHPVSSNYTSELRGCQRSFHVVYAASPTGNPDSLCLCSRQKRSTLPFEMKSHHNITLLYSLLLVSSYRLREYCIEQTERTLEVSWRFSSSPQMSPNLIRSSWEFLADYRSGLIVVHIDLAMTNPQT